MGRLGLGSDLEGFGRDLLMLPVVFVGMAVACTGGWLVTKGLMGHLQAIPLDHPFHSRLMLLCGGALTVGTWMRLLLRENRREHMESLYLAGACWGLPCALGLYLSAPLAAYVLSLPLLGALTGLLVYQVLGTGKNTYGLPLLAVAQVPALWLIVPLCRRLFLGLPLTLMPVPLLLLIGLCCFVLSPCRGRLKSVGPVSKLLWGSAFAAFATFLAVNQPDSAKDLLGCNQYLVVDQDTHKAFRLNDPVPGQTLKVAPKDWTRPESPFPPDGFPTIQTTVLAERIRGQSRNLTVAFQVPAGIGTYRIYFDRQKFRAIQLEGSVELFHGLIHFLGAQDGRMVLTVETAPGEPVVFRVVFQTTPDAFNDLSVPEGSPRHILIHQTIEL